MLFNNIAVRERDLQKLVVKLIFFKESQSVLVNLIDNFMNVDIDI